MSPIALHLDTDTILDRVEITELAPIEAREGYEDGSLLPTGPWRRLTEEEAAGLRPRPLTPDAALVELVCLPDGVDHTTLPATSRPFPTGMVMQYVGQRTSQPGEITTSLRSQEDPTRFGIHVDNWESLEAHCRLKSRRRLCINAGPGRRYLLLGTLDVLDIARTLHPGDDEVVPHTAHIRQWVREGSQLLVLRIRLEPGEGYIAPTELLPHDGSMQDCDEPSTAMFWLATWPRNTLRPVRYSVSGLE